MKITSASRREVVTPFAVLGIIALVFTSLTPLSGPAQAYSITFPDPAFERVWERSDRAVDERRAERSWTWGPEALYTVYEPYAEGPAGQHLVTYLDKSRMEINNPAGDRNSPWFVTNGLLVVDMVSGQVQVGNNRFTPYAPANLPVAGDSNSPDAPTYAALARVASLRGDNRAPNRTGQQVREGLGRQGNTAIVDNLAHYARYAAYETNLGHNIPDVFWSFLNSRGLVYENGRYVEGLLMDWVFVMGYPITEPYWIYIRVNGENRWILMQAFQRRILTYSPQNTPGWRVEMGNVGRAYFDWRYRGQPPAPTPTPAPEPGITVTPGGQVPSGGTLRVQGVGFPPNKDLRVGTIINNTTEWKVTTRANAQGAFDVSFSIGNLAVGTNLAVTALGEGTRVTSPNITVIAPPPPIVTLSPNSLAAGQVGTVTGNYWPANAPIEVGIARPGGAVEEWVINTRADASGNFTAQFVLSARWRNAGQLELKAVVANASKLPRATTPFTALAGGRVVPSGLSMAVSVSTHNNVTTIKARGTGWGAGKTVNVAVVTGDGSLSLHVGQATVRGDRTWEVSFAPNSPWWGRHDLGIQALTTDSTQASVRYLPMTRIARTAGNTHVISGNNWPANARAVVVLSVNGQQEEQLLAFNANADGAFSIEVDSPPRTGNTLIVRTTDGTYLASFGF